VIKQTVVRTYPPAVGYIADSKSTEDLRAYLNKGYRVVMVNKISNKTGEWLEYIVEKETDND
jgi:hypothetical protein